MLKHTISELKEALICLEAGQVTLPYPFAPHPPDENFRGKPVLNTRKCMSCGACGNACPSRLITISDKDGIRTLHFELTRCTYCGNCRDACPQEAIELTSQFELSTAVPADLAINAEFKLVTCRECGAVIGTERQVDLVREKLGASQLELPDTSYLDLCIACKRKAFIHSHALMLEVTP
ncbi:MAG: 4Fe-4S dicluster domain-containing protein [Chloroflexi bacterium]|nr:4Fe-4S dicluster domain-containing protein [Chloroflexota bacterium]